MNTKDYIDLLCSRDKKTLVQKTLKLVSEVGELASKALPYENAYGTQHRFVGKGQLLEELADIELCIAALKYHLNFNDDDFEDMVLLKAKKWDSIQQRADRMVAHHDEIPFEIHITVMVDNTKGLNFISEFKSVCEALHVKPIILDLQSQKLVSVMNDVMTSSSFFGTNETVLQELERINEGLNKAGFTTTRQKIETVPWHASAPFDDNSPSMPKGCYFECHLNVLMTDDKKKEYKRAITKEDCILQQCHISKNSTKVFEDGSYISMLTYRVKVGTYTDMLKNVEKIKMALESLLQVTVEKEVIEFAIYDTNFEHDSSWLIDL